MQDKITFVCCIEYGNLEAQTLLMLKTFRANAGELKNSRFLAVVGRLGASLHPDTLKKLDELAVELIHDDEINPAKWFNYSNKIVAVQIAQRLASTDLIAWIDSDTLFARCPDELLLDASVDFAARGEFLPPAVHPGENVHVPYWKKLCEILEAPYEALPSIELDDRNKTITIYFNSGVFVWRKSSPFAALYYESFAAVIKSRIAQHDGNFFTADQVILGPILIKSGMRWKQLAYQTHHMTFQFQIDGPVASPSMHASSIIHYSKALAADSRARFLGRLKTELPELHDLVTAELARQGGRPSRVQRSISWVLKAVRGLQWRLFAYRVQRVDMG